MASLPGSKLIEVAVSELPQTKALANEKYQLGVVHGVVIGGASVLAIWMAPKIAPYALGGIALGVLSYTKFRKGN